MLKSVVVRNRRKRGWAALVGLIGWLVAGRAWPETTFFPLPEIIVDPNEGTTVGALGIVLVSDEEKQIRQIYAPDVRYNEIFGIYPTMRYFGYPTDTQRFFLSAGKSTEIDEYFEASYAGTDLVEDWLDLDFSLVRDRDSRERFFGIGNDTPEDDESNYTGDTVWGRLVLGFHLPDDLIVSVGSRFRWVRIRPGGVDDIPFTGAVFPPSEVRGIDGELIVGHSLGLWYDTRDLRDIPSEGTFMGANVEIVDRALGSSVSYLRYSLQARTFLPLRQDRKIILALHGFAQFLQGGSRAPFYELSGLGGVSSLRGFGTGRFRDKHRLGGQVEVRAEVYRREIFGVLAGLEVTPFLDIGKVFDELDDSPFSGLHPVVGIGFRAVVKPQVVGYVDFGYGKDGIAPFTGVDYPY